MSPRELDAEVRRRLAEKGAADVDFHVGGDVIHARCVLGGQPYELTVSRVMKLDKESFGEVLEAVEALGAAPPAEAGA